MEINKQVNLSSNPPESDPLIVPRPHKRPGVIIFIIIILVLLLVTGYLFYLGSKKSSNKTLTIQPQSQSAVSQAPTTSTQISNLKPILEAQGKIIFPTVSVVKTLTEQDMPKDLAVLVLSNATGLKLQGATYSDGRTGLLINYNIRLAVSDFIINVRHAVPPKQVLFGSYTEVLGFTDLNFTGMNLRVTASDDSNGGSNVLIQTIND